MKYIIEFEDEPYMYEDGMKFYKCIQAPWWCTSERIIKQLTPYQPEPDCVSKQAALDALGVEPLAFSEYEEGLHAMWTDAREAIEVLPSAQLEPDTRLYSDGFDDGYKQAIKDAQPEIISTPSYTTSTEEPVEYAPIVRCKDCKHRPTGDGFNHRIVFPDDICPCQCLDDEWYSWAPKDDWFCAEAERREE